MADETVSKADFEAMTKRLEKAEADAATAKADATAQAEKVAKMATEKREAECFAKAQGYAKSLPIEPAKFGPILRKIEDGDKLATEDITELYRVLSAAAEANRVGKLFKEIGSAGTEEGSAKAKVAAMVAELRKSNPKLTEQAARGQVYRQNPELGREVEAEDNERAQAGR